MFILNLMIIYFWNYWKKRLWLWFFLLFWQKKTNIHTIGCFYACFIFVRDKNWKKFLCIYPNAKAFVLFFLSGFGSCASAMNKFKIKTRLDDFKILSKKRMCHILAMIRLKMIFFVKGWFPLQAADARLQSPAFYQINVIDIRYHF